MFKTFRHRLLFWFLFFISLGGIILVLTLQYLKQVEGLHKQQLLLQEAQISLRSSVEAQQYFFSYDTKNPAFYISGKGEYSRVYLSENRFTHSLLDSVNFFAKCAITRESRYASPSFRANTTGFYRTSRIGAGKRVQGLRPCRSYAGSGSPARKSD